MHLFHANPLQAKITSEDKKKTKITNKNAFNYGFPALQISIDIACHESVIGNNFPERSYY